jgi:hypothetical protein
MSGAGSYGIGREVYRRRPDAATAIVLSSKALTKRGIAFDISSGPLPLRGRVREG